MESQRLVERLRQVEARFARESARVRLDMRAQGEALQEDLRQTKATLEEAVETFRKQVTGALDRQGSHFARWLLDVETRLDEESQLTQEGLQEMRAILEEHLTESTGTLEDHEARLRRLEQGPAA